MGAHIQYVGAIELTPEERVLLDRITLHLDTDAYEAYSANAKAIPPLMDSLLRRGGIPKHRLEYFDNPKYRSGRLKGSHRNLFERNGTAGRQILEHPHFLPYLRYFLFGADLPSDALDEFKTKVGKLPPITSDFVQDLWKFAKELANKFRLEPHDAAEEFFKLCLDCGVPLMHAQHIREVVRKMRLRKER